MQYATSDALVRSATLHPRRARRRVQPCLLIAASQCGLLLGLFSITPIPIDNTRSGYLGHASEGAERRPRPADSRGVDVVHLEPRRRAGRAVHGGLRLLGQADRRHRARPHHRLPARTELAGGRQAAVRGAAGHALRNRSRRRRQGGVRPARRREGRRRRRGVRASAPHRRHRDRPSQPRGAVRLLFAGDGKDAPAPASGPDDVPARHLQKSPAAAERIVEAWKPYNTKINVFTAREFSFNSQWHWLTKTKAGIALGFAALLGLLVGSVVTSPDALCGNGSGDQGIRGASGDGHPAAGGWRWP